MRHLLVPSLTVCATACAITFLTGCQSHNHSSATAASPPAMQQPASGASAPTAAANSSAAVAPVPAASPVLRIKAGSAAAFTDSSGNVWQAEQGFDGGDVIEREGIAIANTKDPGLYLSEHYGMSSFACNVPNGKYLARLHFAETFEGIAGPGERVFSFNVMGHEFKDFDVFVKAKGSNRAYVESVPVEITNGKFTITFTSNVENPQINAIEIIPQS